MAESIIITYTNLLHKYKNPENKEVQKFVSKHVDNELFMKRVKTLNRLHSLKDKLTDI